MNTPAGQSVLFVATIILNSVAISLNRRSSSIARRMNGDQAIRDYWRTKDGEHQYLEEITGAQAMDWVLKENDNAFKRLGNPEESKLYTQVLSVLDSKDKIPYVSKIGDLFYNFWTDADNPRGDNLNYYYAVPALKSRYIFRSMEKNDSDKFQNKQSSVGDGPGCGCIGQAGERVMGIQGLDALLS